MYNNFVSVGGHGFSEWQDLQKDHNSGQWRIVDQLDTITKAFLFSCCIHIYSLYCPTLSIFNDHNSLIDTNFSDRAQIESLFNVETNEIACIVFFCINLNKLILISTRG